MIRYLESDERQKIRELYERTFQDSASFVEYYFREYVTKGTRCVVDERDAGAVGDELQAAWVQADEELSDGDILAMISIHEKEWCCRDAAGDYQKLRVWYLYGVATVPCERRKGRMQALLERIIEDAGREQVPLLYLIPVDERIYEKAGFRLVRPKHEVEVQVEDCYDTDGGLVNVRKSADNADFVDCKISIQEDTSIGGESSIYDASMAIHRLGMQDAEALACCYEQYYKQQKVDAFLVKDGDYFREYMTQLAIDGGAVYGIYDAGVLVGYIAGSVEEDTFSAIDFVDLECRGFKSLAPYIGKRLGVSRVKLTEHPVMVYGISAGCNVMSIERVMDSTGTDLLVGNWIDGLERIGPMDEV